MQVMPRDLRPCRALAQCAQTGQLNDPLPGSTRPTRLKSEQSPQVRAANWQ
ncbi:hypothetical protein K523DRAFT_358637 [Schizophyllum commune Tattone D]|nr:hypothetical protein K523DRAFT_358637 [Schizophyllum commune Tattone D]